MPARRVLVALLALLLPGVLLAPLWLVNGLGAGEDDILYYFPSRTFFHETVSAGHAPWLNPWTGLGRPFLADPQSAVFYPFTWLFALLQPLHAYPLSLWLHFSLAFVGMYRLLRSIALHPRAAIFGALAFAFCGFLLAHRAHFTMQNAAAWTPFVFWRLHRYVRAGGTQRLLSAACLATLQALAGHAQISALTALGSLVYLIAHAGFVRRVVARWLLTWVAVVGLFAVQWLPTLAYTLVCTRAEANFARFVENSWNPVSTLGWVLPMFFGQRTVNSFSQAYWGPSHQVEQFTYAGIMTLLLAALALRPDFRRTRNGRAWFALLLFGLLMSLGKFGPLYPLLYWLPGASLFRVPARAMLLFNLALAALAAGIVHELSADPSPVRARLRAAVNRWTRRPLLIPLLICVPALLATAAALPLLDERTRAAALAACRPWNPALWIPLVTLAAALFLLGFISHRWQRPGLLWLATLFTAADLAVIGWTLDVPADRERSQAFLHSDADPSWRTRLRDAPQRLWVVTGRVDGVPGQYIDPLQKLVANTNILAHVPTLTHYGPLQPRALEPRFEFRPWGETDRADRLLAETSWTRAFNVGWILLCDAARPAPRYAELIETTPEGYRLFRLPDAGQFAFFEDATQPGAVRVHRTGPNAFTLKVSPWRPTQQVKPPRVIVSQLALPGWRATLDGRPLPIELAYGALSAVRVPADRNVEIEWTYFPRGLVAGACVSGLSGLTLVLFALLDRSKKRRRGRV